MIKSVQTTITQNKKIEVNFSSEQTSQEKIAMHAVTGFYYNNEQKYAGKFNQFFLILLKLSFSSVISTSRKTMKTTINNNLFKVDF